MAKAKGTGKSSYSQICCRLAATSGYGRVRAIILDAFEAARVDKIVPENPYSKGPNGRRPHSFEIDFGNERPSPFTMVIARSTEKVEFNIYCTYDHLFSEEDIEREILPFFGTKTCPTYFCKREKVLKEMSDFIKREISKDEALVEARKAAEARIYLQAMELYTEGAVDRAIQGWYDDEAVKEIRTALLKFRDLKADVIKRALDEYVVHDIMQS
jgi:hypothetical protein